MEKISTATFQRWKTWANKIKDDLQGIINNHQVHEYFFEMVNANLDHIKKNHGIIFCNFLRKSYGVYAAIGIRRHVKNEKDSISLMKLLTQLKKGADQFTYDFYLQQFPLSEDNYEWQKFTFANFSENQINLSENIISRDMDTINNIAGKVSDFVDRAIAHIDQRGIKENVTYNDLSDSLDLFNKTTCNLDSRHLITMKEERYRELRRVPVVSW
jgi:hypothetical protein